MTRPSVAGFARAGFPRRFALRAALVAIAAFAALSSASAWSARAGEPPAAARALPFSTEPAEAPPLPVPVDRLFAGEITAFDGDRISLRWDWASSAQLGDFEPFVPVRATLTGGFALRDGKLHASGTGGLRLRAGLLPDFDVRAEGKLLNPHDLGVVLSQPGAGENAILCLVQDVLFTSFDAAAGRCNMINRLGGDTPSAAGLTEFRYIARRPQPKIEPGEDVALRVERKGTETVFTITPKKGEAVVLRGRDNGTPLGTLQPGLYVSGGEAEFGPLTISGKLDTRWCADHGILPHVSKDLLHSGNRWKPAERRAAETVERFARQSPSATLSSKDAMPPDAVIPIVGDAALPLVIRMRAAEALTDHAAHDGEAGGRLAALLDAKDASARTLAWQVLRPRLPWHFRYTVDAAETVRREAAAGIAAWFREHVAAEEEGRVFVDGKWATAAEADALRASFDHAWELSSSRVRLRTNLPKKQAEAGLAALGQAYAELVRMTGREPPAEDLPLSVLLFRTRDDFAAFCRANGWEQRAAWGRFVDVERNVSLAVVDAKDGFGGALGQFAKQFHRRATGRPWPAWYEEGRASWFGNADYGTSSFDGTTLKVGLVGRGGHLQHLAIDATQNRMPPIADVVSKDPRTMTPEARRTWYAESWALHMWLRTAAPAPLRDRLAQWEGRMEAAVVTQDDVDEIGRKAFLDLFGAELPKMDPAFREWVEKM